MKHTKTYLAAFISVIFSTSQVCGIESHDDFCIEDKTPSEVLELCAETVIQSVLEQAQAFIRETSKEVDSLTAMQSVAERIQTYVRETPAVIEQLKYKQLLSLACEQNRLDLVQVAIDAGADINASVDEEAITLPLHSAIRNHNLELVDYLLEQGANVELSEFDGITPLMVATMAGNTKIVASLLRHQANVRAQNHDCKRSVLHYAVLARSSEEVVKMLLDNGADVNACDADGRTAFELACIY